VTEAEWLAGTQPVTSLEFLRNRVSARKLRLFPCACCRRLWHLLTDDRGRRAVELAEQFADGKGRLEDLTVQAFAAEDATLADAVAALAAYADALYAAAHVMGPAAQALAATVADSDTGSTAYWDAYRDEVQVQERLLRCIVGNPFRAATTDPERARRNRGTVTGLAEAIYQERAFDRLPVLADALEEAGCTDAELLGHLRDGGTHVRGCWALDSVREAR
jgi:hypothetical protein